METIVQNPPLTQVVNRTRSPFDVYIGRGSKWGNPFSHKTGTKAQHIVATREEAVAQYRIYLWGRKDLLDALHELDGKRLGCYCKPLACHGDVLVDAIEWARREGRL